MQHNRMINEIIGRFCFFLTCSLCIFLSSCASTPEAKKADVIKEATKEPTIKETVAKENKDVNKPLKKKMNKVEFGLKVQSHLKNGEVDESLAMLARQKRLKNQYCKILQQRC